MHAKFIGTIDFCHFIALSVALILPGGTQGHRKAKLFGFISSHIFQLIEIKLNMV